MSGYDNVIGGKPKLKGKALDVKVGGVKKKKTNGKHQDQISEVTENELQEAGSAELHSDPNEQEANEGNKLSEDGKAPRYNEHLTPAEKRCIEQRERIDVHRLAKTVDRSQRDRI